ncbi:MAG: VWA domain-containing protein [Bdellovibrionaceae bacterium]|nr:VWA domain-containing protein [Pseudobdellovibrionaceae bacterium]NUM57786.1 VWA domain-containing protein [Pseudobdellovibrionaceae bacterium]
MRFENLSAFWLLLLVPAMLILSYWINKYYEKKVEKVLGKKMLPFLTQSLDFRKRKWKWFLQSLVLLLAIVAYARPQLGQNQTTIKSVGFEIMLAVDVSESMLAEDVKPSRLEQAKLELARLLDLMPGNKVGLIAFAGSAALISPLTNDSSAIKMYLDSLSPQMISNQGTNFESALKYATESFEKGGVGNDGSSKVTRVILVASDGEDQEEGALKAAQELTQKGIRLFTIAYGTEKGATIPQRDRFGYLKGSKADKQGKTIITAVKGEFLKQLAIEGKGSFYFSVFGGNHINNLVEDFTNFEKAEFETKAVIDYDEKFQIFLVMAFIIGVLELLIGERKNQFKFWRGRYAAPQK